MPYILYYTAIIILLAIISMECSATARKKKTILPMVRVADPLTWITALLYYKNF